MGFIRVSSAEVCKNVNHGFSQSDSWMLPCHVSGFKVLKIIHTIQIFLNVWCHSPTKLYTYLFLLKTLTCVGQFLLTFEMDLSEILHMDSVLVILDFIYSFWAFLP